MLCFKMLPILVLPMNINSIYNGLKILNQFYDYYFRYLFYLTIYLNVIYLNILLTYYKHNFL
jgi:hypothetical protein